jgi:dolichol-phosphate mannosyltransferase
MTTSAKAVWVCLPTYNEAENLEPMVEGILMAAQRANLAISILVIDDASPDGTGAIADRLAQADTRVRVLHRQCKQGIGPAYKAGFQRALAEGADLIVEMDCDFSHDPLDIPRLVVACEQADLALGSRYVAGGAVREWGLPRRVISRMGCLYAQVVLASSVKDLTGGFKCFRREVLETIPLQDVTSVGYVFQVELTFRAVKEGFSVVEVPITFVERRAGASKMSGGIVAEAAYRIPLLRAMARRWDRAG